MKKLRFRANLWSGVLSLVAALALFILIPQQIAEDVVQGAGGVTSRTIPYVVMVLFAVCGVALIVQSLVFKKDEIKEVDVKQEGVVLSYMVILILYGVFFKSVGFLITTGILSVITLAYTGCKKVLYYIITLASVGGLYVIFKILLHVRLP